MEEQKVSSCLKNKVKEGLQEMMNVEFDNSIGYSKYDNTIEKTNYRNGSVNKRAKLSNLDKNPH